MVINHEVHASSDNEQWGTLTALADKMGELDTLSSEEDLETQRRELLDSLATLNDDMTDEEQQAFEASWEAPKDKELWSKGFVEDIKRVIYEKSGDDLKAYELMELGMPVELILENKDYYNEMIEDGSSCVSYFPSGAFNDLYHAMQDTEDDKSKFQKDFIESGLAQEYANRRIEQILQFERCDDSTIEDLKIIKSFGVGLLGGDLTYYNYGESSRSKEGQRRAGRNLAIFLDENGILDGRDVAGVYEKALLSSYSRDEIFGIIDVAVKKGVEVATDNPDVEYWHSLSLRQHENMLCKFVDGAIFEEKMIQENFDFTEETVMRMFARKTEIFDGKYTVEQYQTRQFREALKLPASQDIIMQALEEKQRSNYPFREGADPSLFLMLAQDRQILDDMRARGAFDQYEKCKEIDVIDKISSGNYDERYRLSLFLDKKYVAPELFDEKGEPNDNFMEKASGWEERRRKNFRYSYCLDSYESSRLSGIQKAIDQLDEFSAEYSSSFTKKLREGDFAMFLICFDENGPKSEFWQKSFEAKDYNLLAGQDDETKAKMGFDQNTMGFLNSYAAIKDASLINTLDSSSILEYFDENGPKSEFWQKSLEEKDYSFLAGQDDETKAKMGFDQKTMGFLNSYAAIEYARLINALDSSSILEYFDENGPKSEFWQKSFEEKDYSFLARQDDETKAKMDFDQNTMGFLNSYDTIKGARLINVLDPSSILEYFDENGPKSEFWQKSFEEKDYSFLARQDDETKAKMGLDGNILNFINGVSGNVFGDTEKTINKQNIIAALTRFIEMDANDWWRASEDDLAIKEAFSSNEAKDLAFKKLMEIYGQYLNSDKETKPHQVLTHLSDFMHKHDGAGPLSQIEAFLDFAGGLDKLDEDGRILTRGIEDKMSKYRWDNQEKANFYAISAEVIQASPEIYQEFAKLFVNIPDKKDFQAFTTEIYPLYRAKLALLRDYEDHSDGIGRGYTSISYQSVDLDELKNQLHTALLPFNLQEDAERRQKGIDRVKEIILGEISGLFQSKFGLLPEAIPQGFDKTDTNAVEAMTLYFSNLANPTERKKDIMGYFLALQFNKGKAWDKMRSGVDVSPGGLMNVVSAFNVQGAIETSRQNSPLNSANLRIEDPERRSVFCTALQSETKLLRISDTATIDLKLQNLIGNIEELTDPDLYPEAVDRQRVTLLKEFSPKLVGKVAAGMHQRLNGRDVPVSDGEQEVIDKITGILSDNNLAITPENIKTYFQVGLKGLKEPFSMLDSIENSGATEAISELQHLLVPPDNIIQIFNRLGESFSTQSGAMAIGADLDFLEDLASKKENEMSEEETASVESYIGSIREKMSGLYEIYGRVVQNFQKMQKSIHEGSPTAVKDKIRDIEQIIADSGEQRNMTITCTTDMATIINNMRACLSCKTKGINNDTDLTFGEGYKFFLYSTTAANKPGSNSDEIVYFVPMGENEDKRMSFVMDQIYGTKNQDTLLGHAETILKKARALKSQFPEVPISVTIPASTLSSCSTSLDASGVINLGLSGLSKTDKIIDLTNETVNVPVSGFGDHYIEFGGGARFAGDRQVSGIEIIL